MSKKELTEADKILFQKAVQGVKKLTQTKVTFPSPKIKLNIRKLPPSPSKEPIFFSNLDTEPPVATEAVIFYAVPGIQNKVLRKLRRGQYNIEAILDLHGKTVTEAEDALSHFLLHCQKEGKTHVLIIHGKGRSHKLPILKNKLNNWLRQTNKVLAFYSAVAKYRNTGALYVLLRKEQ